MNIVFFSHPDFISHQSMPRFTRMLALGMEKRGHTTEIWYPKAKFFRFSLPQSIKKWMGYIDQYILFPREVRKQLRRKSGNTLYVFTDQALGPWVPLVAKHLHVIHCHDFLAQRSALGEIPENKTSWTGKQYQSYIRRGYQKGENFISVSKNTQTDLHRFLVTTNYNSGVVYNGLNNLFKPYDAKESRAIFGGKAGLDLAAGYLLHVGGNQWYKNRSGVLELYDAWRTKYHIGLPLIMIGESPSDQLTHRSQQSLYSKDIHFLCGIEDAMVRFAYTGASLFLFPSFAEGFGWPIAEAMACGCPVLTTDEAPMTEVAGKAGFFIPVRPAKTEDVKVWAQESARMINLVVMIPDTEREKIVQAGIEDAKRFNTENALNQIEKLYLEVMEGRKPV